MKPRNGFTLVELLTAMSVTVLIAAAAALTLKQVYGGTSKNNSHIIAAQQVENAGFWISRDAQRAEIINTTNLTGSNLVTMNWTEWDANGNPAYYAVNYTFYNLTGNVGQLKRIWTSNNTSQQTLVGIHLYYNPADDSNTSKATFLNPVLTLRLNAMVDQAGEIRQYTITRRPNI